MIDGERLVARYKSIRHLCFSLDMTAGGACFVHAKFDGVDITVMDSDADTDMDGVYKECYAFLCGSNVVHFIVRADG
jgi:hypothetical protein